jgi:hypothetical protein
MVTTTMQPSAEIELPSVQAAVTYSVDTGVKPVNESTGPNGRLNKRTGTYDVQQVTIRNGRPLNDTFSLDGDGFMLVDQKTEVSDFFDTGQLETVYYREIENLLMSLTGASRVVIFDHTLRSGDEATQEAKQIREPVKVVHNDYTDWSGPQRVRDLLPPDEAEALLQNRVAVIQVWRAINQPIQKAPLAICDAQSMTADDLIAAERRHADRVGEIYQISHNPNHRWFYFPEMTRDEALVFKCYDSKTDGRARFTAHGSFDDPTSRPDAPPRESIEARALVFFPPEA